MVVFEKGFRAKNDWEILAPALRNHIERRKTGWRRINAVGIVILGFVSLFCLWNLSLLWVVTVPLMYPLAFPGRRRLHLDLPYTHVISPYELTEDEQKFFERVLKNQWVEV
jgi:hypothetical protein